MFFISRKKQFFFYLFVFLSFFSFQKGLFSKDVLKGSWDHFISLSPQDKWLFYESDNLSWASMQDKSVLSKRLFLELQDRQLQFWVKKFLKKHKRLKKLKKIVQTVSKIGVQKKLESQVSVFSNVDFFQKKASLGWCLPNKWAQEVFFKFHQDRSAIDGGWVSGLSMQEFWSPFSMRSLFYYVFEKDFLKYSLSQKLFSPHLQLEESLSYAPTNSSQEYSLGIHYGLTF